MSSREFFLQYNSVKGQTDMADYVSLTDQRRMFVPLPPVAIQDQIVASLDPIDEKIELNRKMNETLEQMARAIFRSWFIDFDPVHAKAAGKFPFGMDSETASLFPDCFEKSELGDVPTNWKVCSLGEIATVKHGYAFQGEFFSEEPTDMVLMTPGNFAVGGGFKADKFKFYRGPVADEYILAEGDLVVTMTDLSKAGDTLGYGAFIGPLERGRKALHNQRVGKVIALGSQGNLQYLYQVFCSPAYRHHVLGSATGSTVRHTSPSRILEHKIALAPEQLRLHFSKLVEPLFLLQRSLVRENLSLVETRDLFLPRLLSGDVALKDVS
jgi:type I restriction enzyme S subunit